MGSNSQLNNLLFSDVQYVIVILLIIIISACIGGMGSYYLNESEENSKLKCIVLGLVASLIVPLFLNMISSNLLFEARRQIDKLFIFAGFCVLASVFSRKFLEDVYNKLMKQVGDIGKKIENLEEASSEPDIPSGEISDASLNNRGITKIEFDLLNTLSMSKYAYRSISGLIKDSTSDSDSVKSAINTLLAKKLIDSRLIKNNQTRYFISSEGRKLLGELSIEQNNIS